MDSQDNLITLDGRVVDMPTEDTALVPQPGYFGRAWNWLNEPGTGRLGLALRGFLGTASLTSTIVTTYFTVTQFQQDERSHVRSMLYGAGLGISTTVLTGCLLPIKVASAVADWCARWSFEGLQILTQFYLNAGCPIDGNGFWDPTHVPLAVKELAMIIFAGVSISIALLSLRTLLFPQETEKNPLSLLINDDSDGEDIYIQEPKPIPILESGRDDNRLFIAEQVIKGILGAAFIGIVQGNIFTSPQLLYLGYYLSGHLGGVFLGKAYHYIKDEVDNKCPARKGVIERIDKIGRIINTASYAIFFAWTDSTAFLPLGVIAGISKMIALHKFEFLEENDEKVAPFEWKRWDNVAKGALLGLIIAWYGSGLSDVGVDLQAFVSIGTYLSTTTLSYPFTRWLAAEFEPRKNNRVFNTLRFYFIEHNQVLILPYMLIRSAQSIGDNRKNSLLLSLVQDAIAWGSLGLASGNNRALMGIRSERSPNEMSQLAELIAWYILDSQGRFR